MYVLGQMLTPDPRTQVLGEATTFGNEWLEHETRGKKTKRITICERITYSNYCIKK